MSKTLIFDPSLRQRITNFIESQNLIKTGQTIIVGCSGGPDSLFLLYLTKEFEATHQCTILVAHLDHEWRTDSARDVLFCKERAQELGLMFVTEKACNILLQKKVGGSVEETGRLKRRAFFASIATNYPDSIVALGHHADDQQETFFIRLLRGSGITGLAGIKPRDGNYIHPLLCCTKQEIIATLEKNNIPFLADPTNESDQFLRNRIRMQVIPALRECDNRFDDSIKRTMDNLREADLFLNDHTKQLFEACSEIQENRRMLELVQFLSFNPFMQKRVLLHWFIQEKVFFVPSDAFFEEVMRFIHNKKSNEHTFYQTWSIVKKAHTLAIKVHERVRDVP